MGKLKPECCGCASTANLYGSNCKHLTICFNCGKSMAEKKQKCSVCGTLLTRLIREYNVRASSEKDNKYFIAKFANGLPDFNNSDTWSHRKDPGMLKILETGKYQYEGRRQESERSSYYILIPKNQQLVAIPAHSWYNFSKVPRGNHQLTLEQAEAKIKDLRSSTRGCGKWIKSGVAAVGEASVGRGHEKSSGYNDEEDLDKLMQVSDDEIDPVETGDDWEHQEIFSDDDEEVGMAGSLPARPEINQELEVAEENGEEEGFLSRSGKDMKNLRVAAAKSLNESKETEVDDSVDETNSIMEEKKSVPVCESNTIMNVARREATSTLSLSSSASAARMSVTEEEIRSVLLGMGPVTTKELSNLFSARLKTKEDHKAFTSIVKKIASIQRKAGSKGHVVLKRKRVAV